MLPIDLKGQRFGRWVVLASAGASKRGEMLWGCRCDCGNTGTVASSLLRNGRSQSCGCLRVELGRARGAASRRHGEGSNKRETVEYRTWSQMLCRCRNPKHKQWKDYGGRGIVVCERWHRFENFLADMGRRPDRFHSLDRVDVNGNYEPGNCRWATAKEQNRNTRRTIHMTIDGETKPFQAWLEQCGVSRATFYRRCATGMTPRDALFHRPS